MEIAALSGLFAKDETINPLLHQERSTALGAVKGRYRPLRRGFRPGLVCPRFPGSLPGDHSRLRDCCSAACGTGAGTALFTSRLNLATGCATGLTAPAMPGSASSASTAPAPMSFWTGGTSSRSRCAAERVHAAWGGSRIALCPVRVPTGRQSLPALDVLRTAACR